MFAKRISQTVVTATGGGVTAYMDVDYGRVLALHYAKTDFATGVDFTITAEATGEQLWTESNVNASASRYPRAPVHTTSGAGVLTATGGTGVPVVEPLTLANDRIKIVVANGGNTKTGSFTAIIG